MTPSFGSPLYQCCSQAGALALVWRDCLRYGYTLDRKEKAMLIDDLISDAKTYVENHLEIMGANNLPEMEIQKQFLQYAYQEIDCPHVLAELWLEDTSLGLVTESTGSRRYPDVYYILQRNAAGKIADAMYRHWEDVLHEYV